MAKHGQQAPSCGRAWKATSYSLSLVCNDFLHFFTSCRPVPGFSLGVPVAHCFRCASPAHCLGIFLPVPFHSRCLGFTRHNVGIAVLADSRQLAKFSQQPSLSHLTKKNCNTLPRLHVHGNTAVPGPATHSNAGEACYHSQLAAVADVCKECLNYPRSAFWMLLHASVPL